MSHLRASSRKLAHPIKAAERGEPASTASSDCHSRRVSLRSMADHVALRRVTARQHGLITRSQLSEIGFPPGSVAHARDSGQLDQLSDRVLRLGGSVRTSEQLTMAAALDLPGGAVALSSAAALWEATGFELDPVHVLTDRRPHRGGIHLGVAHTSTSFTTADVTSIRGIPVTTPLRTLRDLAGRIHFDRLDLLCERMQAKRLIGIDQLHSLGRASLAGEEPAAPPHCVDWLSAAMPIIDRLRAVSSVASRMSCGVPVRFPSSVRSTSATTTDG